MQTRELIIKFILFFMITGVALYFGMSYLANPQQAMFVFITAAIAITIFIKPFWGLVLYTLYLPFVKESTGLSAQEFLALGIILLLCSLWFMSRSKKWSSVLEINRIERSLVIIFLYMIFSLFVGLSNGVTFIDWGRDLFPLAHLALILPMIHFVDNEQEFKILFIAFIVVMTYPLLLSFLHALMGLGILSHFTISWVRGTSFAMYILITLAMVSYMEYRKIIPLYVIPGFIAIGLALLKHPRTVWVGTAISMLVLLFLSKNKGRWLTIMMVGFIAVSIFVSYVASKDLTFIDRQKHWMETFQKLDDDLSWQSRVAETEQALALFRSSPVFGQGLGYQYNFWRPFVRGLGPGYLKTNLTHSDGVNYLAKTGILGVLALLYLFYNVILVGIKFYNQAADPEDRMVYLLGIAGVIVALIVCNSTPVLQIRYNASALAFLVGFIFVKKKLAVIKEEQRTKARD